MRWFISLSLTVCGLLARGIAEGQVLNVTWSDAYCLAECVASQISSGDSESCESSRLQSLLKCYDNINATSSAEGDCAQLRASRDTQTPAHVVLFTSSYNTSSLGVTWQGPPCANMSFFIICETTTCRQQLSNLLIVTSSSVNIPKNLSGGKAETVYVSTVGRNGLSVFTPSVYSPGLVSHVKAEFTQYNLRPAFNFSWQAPSDVVYNMSYKVTIRQNSTSSICQLSPHTWTTNVTSLLLRNFTDISLQLNCSYKLLILAYVGEPLIGNLVKLPIVQQEPFLFHYCGAGPGSLCRSFDHLPEGIKNLTASTAECSCNSTVCRSLIPNSHCCFTYTLNISWVMPNIKDLPAQYVSYFIVRIQMDLYPVQTLRTPMEFVVNSDGIVRMAFKEAAFVTNRLYPTVKGQVYAVVQGVDGIDDQFPLGKDIAKFNLSTPSSCPPVTSPESSTSTPFPTVTTHNSSGLSTGTTAALILAICVIVIIIAIIIGLKLSNKPFICGTKAEMDGGGATPASDVDSGRGATPVDVGIREADLKLLGKVKEGAFGEVWGGCLTRRHNGEEIVQHVAVKKAKASGSDLKALENEIRIFEQLQLDCESSPCLHLVHMEGVLRTSTELLLVMEFVPYGTLLDLLRGARANTERYQEFMVLSEGTLKLEISSQSKDGLSAVISSFEVASLARQVAKGMAYLYERHIIHRDLRAQNVLVDHDKILKICDFGLTRDVYEDDQYVMTDKQRLPLKWMAMESLRYGQFTVDSDVWSFGVLMWEISSLGEFPYPTLSNSEVEEFLYGGGRLDKPEGCSIQMFNMMMRCWQRSPSARPNFIALTNELESILNEVQSNPYLEPAR